MNSAGVVIVALVAVNFAMAVGIVFSKHLSRQNYIELSKTQSAIDELQIEWSRLQIEESTFSEHGLVESVVSERLGMTFPSESSTVMIAR